MSKSEIIKNKQHALASAYWNPTTPSFNSCLAVRIKLSSLANRLSEGPKELGLQELENRVMHIKSNAFTPSTNPDFAPTYKIVWEMLGVYDGEINPTYFLNDAMELKWALCEASREEMNLELAIQDQMSEEEEQVLIDQLLFEEEENEINCMLYEMQLWEEEENELNCIQYEMEQGDDYDFV